MKETTLGHCFGKPRMVFQVPRYLILKKPRSESRQRRQLNVAMSYKVQHERHAAPSRASEKRPCACESRRRNFRQNLEPSASRKVGPLHLTRTYCRLVTASGIAAEVATTTPSREVAATTCYWNFNRMRIREKETERKSRWQMWQRSMG